MSPAVAVFRPDDERMADAVDRLEAAGATPVPDPMLAVEPTGAVARGDADWVVLTSTTGVDRLADAGWTPGTASLAAIGPKTAERARDRGFDVDRVPETYTSEGLVAALADAVGGARVEVARSDHGSAALLEGLGEAGAYVHETVLYRLVRPEGAGVSIDRAVAGDLDAALFTSSLTVEHFLEAAAERGERRETVDALADVTVGCIGPPTRETAEEAGIAVDVVPEDATVDALIAATLSRLD